MRWQEITIKTTSSEIEELCLNLNDLSIEGLAIEDNEDFQNFLKNNKQYWDYVDEDLQNSMAGKSQVKFYLPDDEDGKKQLETVKAALGIEPQIKYVDDADWENNWKQYYKPLEIGEKLLIVPEWEETEDTMRTLLKLDPGLIFGTGSHATTKMCLCAIQNHQLLGEKVLDLGCGSGILGIGAILLGASYVAGCDIDPKAPSVAQANAALNGIKPENFNILAGDILSNKSLRKTLGGGYKLVLANIVADVIIPLTEIVGDFMAPNAVFICSGIIEGRQSEIEEALTKNGFTIQDHKNEDEWHCYVATK